MCVPYRKCSVDSTTFNIAQSVHIKVPVSIERKFAILPECYIQLQCIKVDKSCIQTWPLSFYCLDECTNITNSL